ncbi:MAG: acyl-CoA dehydrogenase family protein [Acidimicrobiales bacterium]
MTVTEDAATTNEARVRSLVEQLVDENDVSDVTGFLGAQFDLGLAWIHFPEGHGGLGLSPKLQNVINADLASAGAPSPYYRNPIGYGMGAPTVVTHGSEEQRARYLRPLFTGEEVWCQLFSEPGAGSDVAGLSTRAVLDGDEWIVNGQKVWTTLAHLSKWGMLVARTDPDQPKHKGLTYFVVDMEAPGVDVRPLRQMTGDAEFNEVYFTDVRIPDAERLGDVGQGWGVSLTTLMNERVSIGGTVAPRGSGHIASAVKAYGESSSQRSEAHRTVMKDELMKLWVRAEVHRLTNMRASDNRKMGDPGPEGSVGKLASADLNKDITSFTMNLMGLDATLYDDYTMQRPETAGGGSTPQRGFLRMRANSIEGGTTEVMKNILGERVLGLPGDIRVDKDRPWIEVPRS